MIKLYYKLTKPGIIYGNAFSAVAGFFLGGRGLVNWISFLGMLFGISLVIASACVFNNIFDADIDAKMERTKNRAMALGAISKKSAFIFGFILLILGILSLFLLTNLYSLAAAILGFIVYVAFYTPIKRTSVFSTLVGAISGATPIVAGYAASTKVFDTGAGLLFFIMFLWQMPHFYAIGLYRLKEYAAANLPVLPIKQGREQTKIHILIYTIACAAIFPLLTYFNFTGNTYLAVMIVMSLYWLWYAILGFSENIDQTLWAKKMFKASLVVLTVFCVIIAIDPFLQKLK